jgi:hypothetical protein
MKSRVWLTSLTAHPYRLRQHLGLCRRVKGRLGVPHLCYIGGASQGHRRSSLPAEVCQGERVPEGHAQKDQPTLVQVGVSRKEC